MNIHTTNLLPAVLEDGDGLVERLGIHGAQVSAQERAHAFISDGKETPGVGGLGFRV
jgi:hypothetical protein